MVSVVQGSRDLPDALPDARASSAVRGAPHPWLPRAVGVACAIAVACAGALLLVAAARADRRFFDRHVILPYYFVRPAWLPPTVRALAVAAGALLLAAARPVARLARRVAARPPRAGDVARAAVALVAALLASEGIMRVAKPPETRAWFPRWEFKVGAPHPRYGWAARPGASTTLSFGGRAPFSYVVAADGRRVAVLGTPRDDRRPALIVIGESVAAGVGLAYDDTFAARTGAALGLEVVDVGEGGYAPDQAYLRLRDLLPSVAHPAAVVSTFVPIELGRMLHDGYPRLALPGPGERGDGDGLVVQPPASGLLAAFHLRNLVHNRLPYAGDAALARALATTGAVLRATAAAARARGAEPLFVIPSPGPARALDEHPEAWIVRALFADAGLPYLLVDLDAGDVIPEDGHPSARGADKIAAAIVGALGPQLQRASSSSSPSPSAAVRMRNARSTSAAERPDR
jgi:hypothetical protein